MLTLKGILFETLVLKTNKIKDESTQVAHSGTKHSAVQGPESTSPIILPA